MTKRTRRQSVFTLMLSLWLTAAVCCGFFLGANIAVFAFAEDDEAATVTTLGNGLNVHFVDVGQGDACVIEFPDNKKMLIDAGENKSANKKALLDYIEKNINDAEGNDIKYFDYVILTHPDSDHCGGMADVLKKYPARIFYRPNVYAEDKNTSDNFSDPATEIKDLGKSNIKDTQVYYNAIKAGYNPDKINGVESTVRISDATNNEISVIEPQGIDKSDENYYSFTFYGPLSKSYSGDGNWNNYSPIMLLEYHNKRFAFSGDAEEKALKEFTDAAKEGKDKFAVFTDTFTVDVFKLGHHGSRNATTDAYVEAITTQASCANVMAVISCGEGNSYKHPHQEALDILTAHGFKQENILRTDLVGDIAFSVRGVLNENGEEEWNLYLGDTAKEPPATGDGDGVWISLFGGRLVLTQKQFIILIVVVVVVLIVLFLIITATRKKGHGTNNDRRTSTHRPPSGKGRR